MNAQIYAEASQWIVELRADEPGDLDRRRFQSWLEISPEHVHAYLELISLWEDSALLDPSRKLDIEALIALSRAGDNVVPLASSDRPSATENRLPAVHLRRHRVRLLVAASLLLGVIAVGGYWNAYQRGTYATSVGQQRTLALPDGTTVELNAATRIRERYSAQQRTVELIDGQALFRVTKDLARPFVVIGGTTSVRAVGTQFDVHKRTAGITVTVLEGRVAILPLSVPQRSESLDRRAQREVPLAAGQQAVVTSSAIAAPKPANTASATAWTRQKLVFESATLSEAAEEFNRFNSRKLVVDPEGLEDFRINGAFAALDPVSLTRFVRFLKRQPGIELVESGDRVHVAKKNR